MSNLTGFELYGPIPWRRPVNGISNVPTPTEATGKRYIVGTEPIGEFAGHANHVARHDGTQWMFDIPEPGWRLYDKGQGKHLSFSGSAWASWPPGGTGGPTYWGDIEGTLNSQKDLDDALGAKADVDHSHGQLHDRQHAIDSASDHTGVGDAATKNVGTGAGDVAAGNHTHASSDPWTFVKLSDDFTTSLATNTNITNFYFTPAANKTYLVFGTLMLRTATATVGARPGIAWPTGLTDATARIEAANSLTVSALQLFGAQTTKNAASTGLATTTHSHYGGLEALIIVGASPSGDFQITLASETAGTNVVLKAGSFFMYREI